MPQQHAIDSPGAAPADALALLARILDALPTPVFVKDPGHHFVLVNDALCRLMGRGAEELLGRTDADFLPPEEVAEFWRRDDLVLATGAVDENEERLTDGAGQVHAILTRKSLLDAGEGGRWLVGVITDITERKRGEEQVRRARDELELRVVDRTAELSRLNAELREQDRRKNEFLAVLAHELRNPLGPLHHALWLLERLPPSGDAAAHARQTIQRQAGQLSRLVDDLLDVTRVARGKIELRRTRIDLVRAVQRVAADHAAAFAARGVTLALHTGAGPLWLDADPQRVAQVLGNLLGNAAKFARPGGRAWLAVEPAADAVRVTVGDDGVGIAPAMKARLFEPFVQADPDTRRTTRGLGLGLSLVRDLVELHGGSVEARSEGEGRGAEFVVTLPLAAAAAEPAEPTPPPRALALPQRRILVVDDDADAADMLREVLLAWDQVVEVAHGGADALRRARAFRPDVLLCDLGLPDVDGFEVARQMRRDPELAATYLVAISGYASSEDQHRALAAGFQRHLPKPVPVDVVEEVLAAAPHGGARLS